jgi:DNA modification methylase
LQGDCLEVLKTLPDNSVDCVMTSPPYWALRDYGVEGQLGLEPTFQEYINKLCDIFDEVKRVLTPTGTCWVNMGDCYAGNMGKKSGWTDNKLGYNKQEAIDKGVCLTTATTIIHQLPQKSLVQIPARFSIEMQNRGWILRNEIIWHKPNCMPSSITDRFTIDFEKIFFFVKSKKYYFVTQYESYKSKQHGGQFGVESNGSIILNKCKYAKDTKPNRFYGNIGRNKRAVWTINTKPYKEAHFSVYPEAVCETPIKAGCPELVCKKCGVPVMYKKKSVGWIDDPEVKEVISCSCNEGYRKGIVLDPFFGSGTTGLVALKQNKEYIGIELNHVYIAIAEQRLRGWRG